MTQQKRSMVFASRSAQNRPFRIADRVFWSKRLTGDDELSITEYQAFSRLEPRRSQKLSDETALVARLLNDRRQGDEPITPEWVRQHIGESSAALLFIYLRTGEGLPPGETFDLRTFDEPIVIDERSFVPRALSYAEQIRGSELVEAALPQTVAAQPDSAALEEVEAEPTTWGEARAMVTQKLSEARLATASSTEALAEWLNARRAETEGPITADWLLRRLSMPEVGLVASYLANGVIPETEAEVPNAESVGDATNG